MTLYFSFLLLLAGACLGVQVLHYLTRQDEEGRPETDY